MDLRSASDEKQHGRRAGGARFGRGRRVAAWQTSGGRWLVVLAEVGGPGMRVLRTADLPGAFGPADLPPPLRAARGAACVLVVGSKASMFRTVDLPAAGRDEMETMLGLRLEAELPYASGEAAWGWQHRPADGLVEATVVALPAADVAEAERRLQSTGNSCGAVEAREAALAQLAACLGNGSGATAVVCVESDAVAVAVARDGCMAYSRVLAARPGADEVACGRVVAEVEQTLDHCVHERQLDGIAAVFVAGSPVLAGPVAEGLRVKTSLPVGEVEPWAGLQVAPEVGAAPEVIGRYAACVGALAAEHARRCGREAAGPLIRGGKPARRARAASDFVRLAVLNVLLLAAFVVSAFAVRSARLHAVTVAMERARPLLAELAPLEEEVRILQAESELLAPKIDLMLAIARALPPGMEVAELRIDRKGHVVIRGTTPSVEAVSKAVAALEAGGELADPRFQRVEPAKQGKTFQIECTVR